MTKQQLLAMPNIKVDRIVKIAGGDYDRRFKLNKKQRQVVKESYSNGKGMEELAIRYNVTSYTIRYIVDQAYAESERARLAEVRKKYGPYTSNSTIDAEARGAYKKELVRIGKIKMKDIKVC